MVQLTSLGQPCCGTAQRTAPLCRGTRSCARSTAVRCFKGGSIDIGNKPSSALRLNFQIPYRVNFGQSLGLVGSGDSLGNWDPKRKVQMKWTDGDWWTVELTVPPGGALDLEYKYVVVNADGNIGYWKPGNNYRVTLPLPTAGTKVPRRVKVADAWDESFKKVDIEETDAQSGTGSGSGVASSSGTTSSSSAASSSDAGVPGKPSVVVGQPPPVQQRQQQPQAEARQQVLQQPSPAAPAAAPATAPVAPTVPPAQPTTAPKTPAVDARASNNGTSPSSQAPSVAPAVQPQTAPSLQTAPQTAPQTAQTAPQTAQTAAPQSTPQQASETTNQPPVGVRPRATSPRAAPPSFAAATTIPVLHPTLLAEQERLEDGVRNSLEDLQAQMDKHQHLRERTEDPAAPEILVADRIVAAANNRVVAYNKALKAVQEYNRLPPSASAPKEAASDSEK